MSREDYLASLKNAVDALEVHIENTKVYIGSPVEKTAKFQELIAAKTIAFDLMLNELDVLSRAEIRKGKKELIMTAEEKEALNKRVAEDQARRKHE